MNHSLRAVTLRNFRSYQEASYEFDQGVNIIIGPNAAGKTNLLEAVYSIGLGKGFRGASDSELIATGKEWTRVDAYFGTLERVMKLEKIGTTRLKKHFETGGRKTTRLNFDELVPIVLFQPDDLRLASGGPERRRNYIDALLSQLIPTYQQDLHAYNRALRQRNALLKSGGVRTQLFVWNIQLAERGGRIAQQRQQLIERISERISAAYSAIAGKRFQISMTYESSFPTATYHDQFLKKLEATTAFDIERGYTGFGPHRDDINFTINNKPFKQVASRGENRTLILALKSIELEEIRESHGDEPLLLLDDVFSELDGSRRKLLTSYLKDSQTLITTTDADVVAKEFVRHTTLIKL